jgi:hypothetical protein
MNLVLEKEQFKLGNTHFLDTKRNVIIDGNFTKILYSNDSFIMNGIYILFNIDEYITEKISNKCLIKFNPYSKNNFPIIQEFANLEFKIIEHYKQMNGINNRKISNLLSKQLYNGIMKIYKEHYNKQVSEEHTNSIQMQCVIKISGIWETKDEIGITFKIFQII